MGVIGMLMGEKHGMERVDLSIEELLAQIQRRIDQHAGDRAVLPPFHRSDIHRRPVFEITGVRGCPSRALGAGRHPRSRNRGS